LTAEPETEERPADDERPRDQRVAAMLIGHEKRELRCLLPMSHADLSADIGQVASREGRGGLCAHVAEIHEYEHGAFVFPQTSMSPEKRPSQLYSTPEDNVATATDAAKAPRRFYLSGQGES
jgi:hypothetical protein